MISSPRGGSRSAVLGCREGLCLLAGDGGKPSEACRDLASSEAGTISAETAGENLYGLRFYGGNVKASGQYLAAVADQRLPHLSAKSIPDNIKQVFDPAAGRYISQDPLGLGGGIAV